MTLISRRPAAMALACLLAIAFAASGAAAQFPHERRTGEQDRDANQTLVDPAADPSDENETGVGVDVDSPFDEEFGEDSRNGDNRSTQGNGTADDRDARGTPAAGVVVFVGALVVALQLGRRRG